jgi:hypothetical protein
MPSRSSLSDTCSLRSRLKFKLIELGCTTCTNTIEQKEQGAFTTTKLVCLYCLCCCMHKLATRCTPTGYGPTTHGGELED